MPPEPARGAAGRRLAYAYAQALGAGRQGDCADGTPRTFTCQSCHLPPVTGVGCNKRGAPLRHDLPLHDMTGGNYWMPEAIKYLDGLGKLRRGGGLTPTQIAALDAGVLRARANLERAASLSVDGNTVRVVNLTAHKLISGYPEGRRMWLNVRCYDASQDLLREDGAYGPLGVVIDGQPRLVDTILDLEGANTRIYEAHYAMTRQWAQQLLLLGHPASLPLGFDRVSGAVTCTLGMLAGAPAGSREETFHFVLNNHVEKDNRLTDCDDPDCAGNAACGGCDGDGTCEPGESCETCPDDCEGKLGGKPSGRFCCGNGIPEPPEGDGGRCDGNF